VGKEDEETVSEMGSRTQSRLAEEERVQNEAKE
jgi:hypothetical protein